LSDSKLVDIDDLDAFEKAFFDDTKPVETDEDVKEAEDEVEEDVENEDDALATEDEAEDETEDEAEDEPEPKPEPKKKQSFQERINELTAKARNEERRAAELERRLADLEARKTEETKSEVKPPLKETDEAAPSPDAVDDKGEPVYPLGEFDPKFIRDLTRFTITQETKAAKEQAELDAQQAKIKAQQEELVSSWASKLEEVEKEVPDLREKIGTVETAFANLDPGYGEYLAATIMSCDFGPQIMYYLSQNIGEAQKIVASGPAAATLAIGRLDAKFVKTAEPEKRNTKVSSAPKPSENRIRGSAGKFSVPADTDDLDAFERAFFDKKK
jgi:hypothetical protein